jgi:hypothetical protein
MPKGISTCAANVSVSRIMNIPSLPTDSLAKFQAVGGLLLVASLVAFIILDLRSLGDEMPHIKADSEALLLRYSDLQERLTILLDERQILSGRLNEIDSELLKLRCPSDNCARLGGKRSHLAARGEEIVREVRPLRENLLEVRLKLLKERAKGEAVVSRIQINKDLRWLEVLLGVLGVYFMNKGFYAWGANEARERAAQDNSKTPKRGKQ